MSRSTKASGVWVIFALSLLVACGNGSQATDPSVAYTQIALTVQVAQTQTAFAASPTPTSTNTPNVSPTPQASNTPLITSTPMPGTPSVTPYSMSTATRPANTQAASCDNMVGVADVTYPDFSEVPAGLPFIKTWSVKNLGPCTWDKDYRLIFGWGGDGTNWNTTPPSFLNQEVLPGETVEISVTLLAPTTAGTYGASFRLQNSKGYNFGPQQTVIVIVK